MHDGSVIENATAQFNTNTMDKNKMNVKVRILIGWHNYLCPKCNFVTAKQNIFKFGQISNFEKLLGNLRATSVYACSQPMFAQHIQNV